MDACNWVNGEWISRKEKVESINPANMTVIGSFSEGGKHEALEGVEAARSVFEQGVWSHSPRLREKVLLSFADRLEAALPELIPMLTEENGKLIGEATGELNATVSELRYYAGLARNVFGRITELEPGLFATLARDPIGVAGIIVPWNAPAVLMVRSLAPALAAGCTCVVKTAPQTALLSERLFRIMAEITDLPPGTVNMFTETGSAGAEALVTSPDVDIISYTGSTSVGKKIMEAGASTMKRLSLELGGSAPCIILDDADVQAAAQKLAHAGMFMSGQYCCSATRILVHEDKLDETQAAVTAALKNIVVGPGADAKSQMGPMIDEAGFARVIAMVANLDKADTLICGGEAMEGDLSKGYFLSPGLIHSPNPSSIVYREEVFGPLLVIDSFGSDEEALFKANDSRFGLAASVWSQDLRRSKRLANKIQCGTVWINSHGRTFAEIENGGFKESGLGRLHGLEGLAEFLETKAISWSTEF